MNTDLSKHLKDFFQTYLRDQRGLSIHTVRSYRDTFKLLIHYLQTKNGNSKPPRLQDLDPKTLLVFLQHLEDSNHGRGNCAGTRNHRLLVIKSFFNYISLHYPSFDQHAKRVLAIPRKRVPKKEKESLSRQELEALLAQPQTTTSDGIRDLALLTFLYNVGARASEAAGLRLSSFDFSERTVKITGKGSKDRTTPLWPHTVKLLKLYVEHHRRKPKCGASDFFFIDQRGLPFTRFGIRSIVKRHLKSAAKRCPSLATKRLSAHNLRHTCASHLLESTVDPNAIKGWLGHEELETTSEYTHSSLSFKRRILEQFGPPRYVASLDDPQQKGTNAALLDWLDDL